MIASPQLARVTRGRGHPKDTQADFGLWCGRRELSKVTGLPKTIVRCAGLPHRSPGGASRYLRPQFKRVWRGRSVFVGRVGMWRGGGRIDLSVSAPLVWRCLNSRAITPFPHPAHRTGRADFPHPALGQDLTPSRKGSVRWGSQARTRRRAGARAAVSSRRCAGA